LAKALGIQYGRKFPPSDCGYILSWGAGYCGEEEIELKSQPFNSLKAIHKNAYDKYNSLGMMTEQRVPVPKHCPASSIDEALKRGLLEYPVIGRKNSHRSGSGFYLCMNNRDLKNNINKTNYFLQYIPVAREYRINICFGKVARCHTKTPTDGCDSIVRTHSKGWLFEHIPYANVGRNIIKQAQRAMKAVGLNYGAVDIIKAEDGGVYVLEVNSAPALGDAGLENYVDRFQDKLEELDIEI